MDDNQWVNGIIIASTIIGFVYSLKNTIKYNKMMAYIDDPYYIVNLSLTKIEHFRQVPCYTMFYNPWVQPNGVYLKDILSFTEFFSDNEILRKFGEECEIPNKWKEISRTYTGKGYKVIYKNKFIGILIDNEIEALCTTRSELESLINKKFLTHFFILSLCCAIWFTFL